VKNQTCGKPPSYAMHLLRDATPGNADIPWSGIIFGLPISAIWYWCSDQVRVNYLRWSQNALEKKFNYYSI
jgi:sodium/glucose cotransporter 1/sodium/glucose cotransporter 9